MNWPRYERTKFLLFPRPPGQEELVEPEEIQVSLQAGSIGPGPADDRMYAIYPHDKLVTYGSEINRNGEQFSPPWHGSIHEPALPDENGHFTHLEIGTPQFEAAHLYGCTRFVLDIWEGYFDQPIHWHFGDIYERMELVIMPRFTNATMGFGFMEIGGYDIDENGYQPFSLNFDVIGHEVGHSIIYPIIGLPDPERVHHDYYGFHESAADMVALISSLHFESALDHLLETTHGNLYALNSLNRIGKLSKNEQIRIASNDLTLWDFTDGWTDEHDLGQPLTAAIFDTLVDIFHDSMKDWGLVTEEIIEISDALEDQDEYLSVMQDFFDQIYDAQWGQMRQALIEARDIIGTILATTFAKLTPQLTYQDVANALVLAEQEVCSGAYRNILVHNLKKRGIGDVMVGPRLSEPDQNSHAFSVRTQLPGGKRRRCRHTRR